MAIKWHFECVNCKETLHPETPGEPTDDELMWVQRHSEPGHNIEMVIPGPGSEN